MRSKRIHTSFIYTAMAAIIAAGFLILSIVGFGARTARAEASAYSNVLDDLRKDESFNVSDYPQKPNDYSLKVIQIAEGEHDELFVYVYQPYGESNSYKATSINISPMSGGDKYYENFELEYINSSGTLFKYRVLNYYTTLGKQIRIYDISSIYRKWENSIDGEPGNNNTASEKAYAVGQLWTAVTVGNEVLYQCKDVEVLDVTKQFVHYIRYDEGFQWGGTKSCDAHYFAFNCERNIDRLISADLLFYTQEYKRMEGQSEPKLLESRTRHLITVTEDDKGSSKKENWQRLSSVTEFLAEGHKIPNDEREKLKNYDWIINFYETEYERDVGGKDILISMLVPGGFIWTIVNACTTYGTLVTDVTLMRLEFEYEGKIYNLGVVSDKQTGDPNPPKPDTKGVLQWLWECIVNTFTGKGKWYEIVVTVITCVIALVAVAVIIKLIKFVVRAIWS